MQCCFHKTRAFCTRVLVNANVLFCVLLQVVVLERPEECDSSRHVPIVVYQPCHFSFQLLSIALMTSLDSTRRCRYTKAAVRVKHDPPTVGRKDEEEAAAQARLVASNASVALYHLLRVAKGLGAKPTAILMARKMGEPIEHWDQLLIPSWGEPLPVIIRKDGERTISDWSPKRKTVGSGEKTYVVQTVADEPKAAVPRRHLPRYVVKAKRGEGEQSGGKIYRDARRFKDDMLKELRRQIGTPVQKLDSNDLYESVFVGFIAHFTGANVLVSLMNHPSTSSECNSRDRSPAPFLTADMMAGWPQRRR